MANIRMDVAAVWMPTPYQMFALYGFRPDPVRTWHPETLFLDFLSVFLVFF